MKFLGLFVVCLCMRFSKSSSVVLKDNGYEGIVVSVDDKIPAYLCQDVLTGLENLVHASSGVVFETTRRRAYFKDIKILVPSAWTPATCAILQGRLATASTESISKADLRVTKAKHPVYGQRPWTSQSEGCAKKGDYVSFGYDFLLQNVTSQNARQLAKSWLKYQYGVFDEANNGEDHIHAPNYRKSDGEWASSSCSNKPLLKKSPCDKEDSSCPQKLTLETEIEGLTGSFMAFPEVESVTELCDEGSHNPAAPTPQNLICDSKSVWEVLRASPDFQNNRNVEGRSTHGDITFTYLQAKSPRMVVLIEDTNVMNMQKRWDFMRKAIRKLVIYDVPDGLEVGLVVFDSIATTKYPLKPLSDIGTRYNFGSSLPRNPSRVEKHHRCISCGLEESLKLLRQSGGTSGGRIVLMVAGSSKINREEMDRVKRLLAGTNTVLHVIVYPLTEKFPEPGHGIESFAATTGGLSFTIQDEGIGADSKIVMYYNLLDALYHTLSEAAGENVLPVKIHSAEHEGGLAQNSEGSFWLDPGLGSDTVFAVFYYDVAHVGDTIHLTSPQGQVIDTDNMQREDDNMNMITIRLRRNQEVHGKWRYRLENRANSHQSLFVQVTSRPQSAPDATNLNVRTWTNHIHEVNATDIANPLKIFAEVRVNLAPVKDAKVIAVLNRLGSLTNGTERQPITVRLLDNGLLSPDIKRGDGIYSRYVQGLESGKYTGKIYVEGQLGKFKFTRQLRSGIINVVGTKFQIDVVPPSRITDLRAALLPDTKGQVSFTWTAPGNNFDYGQADAYQVFVASSISELKEGHGKSLKNWPSPLTGLSIQQHVITWSKYDKVFYVAIQSSDSDGNISPLSNVVEVFVPNPPTPPPSTVVTHPKFAHDTMEVKSTNGLSLSGFNGSYLPLIFAGVGGLLLVLICIGFYCACAKRKHAKLASHKDIKKDNLSVTISLANKNTGIGMENTLGQNNLKKNCLTPINSWSPTELLGSHKRNSISGSDSEHSGSTKKSYGGSSEPPQYTYNSMSYPTYEGSSYNDPYLVSDSYPSPTDNNHPGLSTYPDGYAESINPGHDSRSYAGTHHAESYMSDSCDPIPGTQGPPGYSPYPGYEGSLRGVKIPPPIPPKPKVAYTPEPYIYDNQEFSSSNASVTSSEKRIRNVTMV